VREDEGMSDNQWHLDKRVPIALIFALVVQTGVVFSWKTNVENRLTHLEEVDKVRSTHEARIIILEQSISYIRSDLTEIKLMLKREASRP
jgi:Tfp pilus assembly protein PilO